EWRPSKPSRLEEREVSRVPPVFPAGDIALRDGCSKAPSLSNHPVRQQSAAASAGDTKFFVVDVAAFYYVIDAGDQIFVIVAWITILNHVPKFLAVTRAAARIRVEHHVTLRRHPLKFMNENVAVGNVRPAMNVQNQRIFFMRIEIWRLLQPCLYAFAVKTLLPNLFRLGEIQFREQLIIHIR